MDEQTRRSIADPHGSVTKYLTLPRQTADNPYINNANEGTDTMNSEYQMLVAECAEQGKSLMRKLANEGVLEPLYLYARKSEPGKSGRLFLVRDSAPISPGVELVTGEGLRSNVPYENYYMWIHERAKRAPILAY